MQPSGKDLYDPIGTGHPGFANFHCPLSKENVRIAYLVYRSAQPDSGAVSAETAVTERAILINGLGTPGTAWEFQLRYLLSCGRSVEVVVLDNRGTGYSSAPKSGYSTSRMAADAVEVLTALGWIECRTKDTVLALQQQQQQQSVDARGIHVAGISMGGMIAQELALLLGSRLKSLTLLVTHAGGSLKALFPPAKGVRNLIVNMFLSKDPEARVGRTLQMIYHRQETRDQMKEWHLKRFMRTPQPPGHAFLGQSLSTLKHRLRPAGADYLKAHSASKIVIGVSHDDLVRPSCSNELAAMIGAELLIVDECGHNVLVEGEAWVNNTLYRQLFKL